MVRVLSEPVFLTSLKMYCMFVGHVFCSCFTNIRGCFYRAGLVQTLSLFTLTGGRSEFSLSEREVSQTLGRRVN